MTSLLAWVLDAVLLLPGKSRAEEDDSISDGCVEGCVDYEEAPVVACRLRTHKTCRDKFYILPGKGKAIFFWAISGKRPETLSPRGQYREYRNQNIEDRDVPRFHTQTLSLQFLG